VRSGLCWWGYASHTRNSDEHTISAGQSSNRPHSFQPSLEERIIHRVQKLLHVPKPAKSRPDFSHSLHVNRVKHADRFDVKMNQSGGTVSLLLKSFIPQKHRRRDDPRPILKEHHRPRLCRQAGGGIRKSPLATRQPPQKKLVLNVGDRQAEKSGDPIAHRPNSQTGNCGCHIGVIRWGWRLKSPPRRGFHFQVSAVAQLSLLQIPCVGHPRHERFQIQSTL
jgi:hypothetical protein